jgi:hypothetical protein
MVATYGGDVVPGGRSETGDGGDVVPMAAAQRQVMAELCLIGDSAGTKKSREVSVGSWKLLQTVQSKDLAQTKSEEVGEDEILKLEPTRMLDGRRT